jgi:hypothetical protein
MIGGANLLLACYSTQLILDQHHVASAVGLLTREASFDIEGFPAPKGMGISEDWVNPSLPPNLLKSL